MITNLKITNCYTFNKTVEFSMKADMRTKRFYTNIYQGENNENILKSSVIYGPNNTGKTSFVNCIKDIKNVLLNKKAHVSRDIFSNYKICELEVSFLQKGEEYQYIFNYDSDKEEYVYEKFSKITQGKENVYYIKDTKNEEYKCSRDKDLAYILAISSKNNILIYTIETEQFPILKEVKEILVSFANNIDIIDMNHIPNSKTIQFLKNKNNMTKKVVEFIKNADLYLENYAYDDKVKFNIAASDEKITELVNEKLLKNQSFMEQIKLVSFYKGKAVPSMLFDSVGTKKIVALASYVLDAIENDRVLVVDELDSSLHFKITRAIIGLFNNEKNRKGQLICTLHDVTLLDCKKMFRKEQIYFTAKDEKQTYLYSLREFTYNKEGIRTDTADMLISCLLKEEK